jgi:molecular chaperone GrpE
MGDGQGMGRQDGGQRPGQPEAPDPQTTKLEAERATLADRLLRLAADFENWKKRSAREVSEAEQRAHEEILGDVIEVVDGLERALATMTDETDGGAVRAGVELLLRNLLRRLEGYGVKPIPAIGQRFDPRRHHAIARAPSREVEPGTIVDEVQKGYLAKGRLLRPSSVIVAESPDPPAREPGS